MSTNETSEVEARQVQNLQHLSGLYSKLLEFPGFCLATKDLADFGVRISRLDLHSDQNTVADPEQQFFAPQPDESFVELPQPECEPERHADGASTNCLGLSLNLDLYDHLRGELPKTSDDKERSRFEKHATWSMIGYGLAHYLSSLSHFPIRH